MNIVIKAGNHRIRGILYDNPAANALAEQFPVTFPMMNLYGREMCFRMGRGALPHPDAKDQGYTVGDISYWPPAGSLVILYRQNGEIFEQQPIGHIEEDISFLAGMNDTDITFEKEEAE